MRIDSAISGGLPNGNRKGIACRRLNAAYPSASLGVPDSVISRRSMSAQSRDAKTRRVRPSRLSSSSFTRTATNRGPR
jgi:hypothetical protein